MMVSHSSRVLFVHVQKTGGITIDRMLQEALPDFEFLPGLGGGRHARLGPALRTYPELSEYFVFGFVRNPWARLYSWWAMIKRAEADAAAGVEKAANQMDHNRLWKRVLATCPDFEAFVLRGTQEQRELQRTQISYLRAKQREADFIGRQEHFDADLHEVFDRLGLAWPGTTVHANTGPSADYRQHYSEEMRDRVAEVFAADLQRFGYEF